MNVSVTAINATWITGTAPANSTMYDAVIDATRAAKLNITERDAEHVADALCSAGDITFNGLYYRIEA